MTGHKNFAAQEYKKFLALIRPSICLCYFRTSFFEESASETWRMDKACQNGSTKLQLISNLDPVQLFK